MGALKVLGEIGAIFGDVGTAGRAGNMFSCSSCKEAITVGEGHSSASASGTDWWAYNGGRRRWGRDRLPDRETAGGGGGGCVQCGVLACCGDRGRDGDSRHSDDGGRGGVDGQSRWRRRFRRRGRWWGRRRLLSGSCRARESGWRLRQRRWRRRLWRRGWWSGQAGSVSGGGAGRKQGGDGRVPGIAVGGVVAGSDLALGAEGWR